MAKYGFWVVLAFLLAGCSENDDSPAVPPSPVTDIPGAAEVAPLRPGLYITAQGFSNCGIEGVRYAFQDESGGIVGPLFVTDEQGFMDISAAPEGAKYVTYVYMPAPNLIRWDATTFELAMFQADSLSYRVELVNIQTDDVTPCNHIQGRSKILFVDAGSEQQELDVLSDSRLELNDTALVLAQDDTVNLFAYQDGLLSGSQSVNSADLPDESTIPLALNPTQQVMLEGLMPPEEGEWSETQTALRYTAYPFQTLIRNENQTSEVNLVLDDAGSNLASFEFLADDTLSVQRVGQEGNLLMAQPLEFALKEDIPLLSSGVEFPFILSDSLCTLFSGFSYSNLVGFIRGLQAAFPELGIPNLPDLPVDPELVPECNLNDLSYEMASEKHLTTGQFAARYSATYFTGAGGGDDGLCSSSESSCRLVNRNVYAMTEHEQRNTQIFPPQIGFSRGTFFIPDVPAELIFNTLGGLITRQTFVLSDQQDIQFLHSLAGGEGSRIIDDNEPESTPIRRARLSLIGSPENPIPEALFESRYQSRYQAVGKVH
ncbi:hypothetical protein [Ferrimonas gelatinilytica]|uniref:Lipoprotein n=1 Tax=Ferrimonas gelatinilytica TaxID=1255257 RepID=A0ABP9S8N7_9GAMM